MSDVVQRLLDWARGWRASGQRRHGHWYWVTDGKSAWPAVSDPRAVGGWSNHDTWEDFDHKVVAWKRMPQVATPKTGARDVVGASQ